ncbi:MAG: radical SAM family heme chaperone HemW, partial [Actinomycetota bacterium]
MTVALAPSNARRGAWLADPGFGVYVHIPFCRHRCHYCDFNTYEGLEALYDSYVEALVADIERWDAGVPPATSVFFGGGTPTLLSPGQLGRILEAVRRRTGIQGDAEITVEVNPETVDEAGFAALLDAGFNRFSVGIQSLAPHVLEGLGRTHSADRALEALAAARRAGAPDLNADLIYGSPWERDDDWTRSLEGVIEARTDHVSAYALTVEEGTPLHTLVATGRVPDVDGDIQAERHAVADERLGGAGFERYETSNWSRPGRASRHNLLYWSAGNYAGFGAGAHAHVDGRRWWSKRLPREFIAAVQEGSSTAAGCEELDHSPRGPE